MLEIEALKTYRMVVELKVHVERVVAERNQLRAELATALEDTRLLDWLIKNWGVIVEDQSGFRIVSDKVKFRTRWHDSPRAAIRAALEATDGH